MSSTFIWMPLVGAILAGFFVFLFLLWAIKQLPRYWIQCSGPLAQVLEKQLLTESNVDALLNQLDLPSQIKPLLEVRMDGFVEGIKRSNPAIGFFLTPALTDSFKGIARIEFDKLIPELSGIVSKKLIGSPSIRLVIKEKLAQVQMQPFQKLLWDSFAVALISLGALGGLLLGLVLAVLAHYL